MLCAIDALYACHFSLHAGDGSWWGWADCQQSRIALFSFIVIIITFFILLLLLLLYCYHHCYSHGEDNVIHLPSGLDRVDCERQEEEDHHYYIIVCCRMKRLLCGKRRGAACTRQALTLERWLTASMTTTTSWTWWTTTSPRRRVYGSWWIRCWSWLPPRLQVVHALFAHLGILQTQPQVDVCMHSSVHMHGHM